MSAEVVAKKRGRPKKADIPESTKDRTSQSRKSRATKSGTSARDFSTTEVISQKPTAKKPTRRKQTVLLDNGQGDIESAELEQTAKSTVTKPKPKSAILEQAKAFETPASRIDDQSKKAMPLLEPKNTEKEVTASKGMISPSKPETTELAQQEISAQVNEQQAPSSNAFPSSARSSFLSDFLLHSDPAPQISDDSRISDRSAFSTKAPSIDAIVGGAGISNPSTFEAITQYENKQSGRDSAIPITPPKAFKALSLTRFPSASEPSRPSKRIDPSAYATGSFSTFKSTQPLSSIASSSTVRPSPARTNPLSPSAAQMQAQPLPTTTPYQQQTAPLKISSKPQPIQPAPTAAENAPTPTTSPSNQPSRPLASSSSTSLNRPSQPRAPRFASQPGKKRPTEMTPAELHANPEFRTLRRRWTGLIVGIPVLVATTYVLWKRFDMDAKEQEHLSAWLGGQQGAGGGGSSGRERGVLPLKKSILASGPGVDGLDGDVGRNRDRDLGDKDTERRGDKDA